MSEPVRLSDKCRIRKGFMISIGSFLVISLSLLCIQAGLRVAKPSDVTSDQNVEAMRVNEDWVNENLYRVEFYLDNGDGTYDVYLLSVEEPEEETFDELKQTFITTPYSNYNSFHLADGVNCQGMVCYIARWCELNNVDFEVQYTPVHTYIIVDYQDASYKFDFTKEPTITEV